MPEETKFSSLEGEDVIKLVCLAKIGKKTGTFRPVFHFTHIKGQHFVLCGKILNKLGLYWAKLSSNWNFILLHSRFVA